MLNSRVVILPNIEIFKLLVSDGGPGYKLTTHISCPPVRCTIITQKDVDPEQAFCTSDLWDVIVRWYTRSPAEEVMLKIRAFIVFTCKLTFWSCRDVAVIELNYVMDLYDENGDEFDRWTVVALEEVFTQATLVIRNHPQLAGVKHLNICHSFQPFINIFPTTIPHITNKTGRLFKALNSLDKLTIYHCNIRLYLHSFLDIPQDDITEPVSRTGIFHVLFALFFATLTILIFQDLILSSDPHSFKPFHLLILFTDKPKTCVLSPIT